MATFKVRYFKRTYLKDPLPKRLIKAFSVPLQYRKLKKENIQKMKKILFVAIALCAASCSAENDLQETLNNVVESGTNMALDSLHNIADKELQRHTGVDSLASRIRSADTINVEREVKRELLRQLSK